jgi:hypothetical protein
VRIVCATSKLQILCCAWPADREWDDVVELEEAGLTATTVASHKGAPAIVARPSPVSTDDSEWAIGPASIERSARKAAPRVAQENSVASQHRVAGRPSCALSCARANLPTLIASLLHGFVRIGRRAGVLFESPYRPN